MRLITLAFILTFVLSAQIHAISPGMTIRQVNNELGDPTAQMTKGIRTVNFYSNGQRLNFINGILDSIDGYELTQRSPAPKAQVKQEATQQSTAVTQKVSLNASSSRNKVTTFGLSDSEVSNRQMVYYLSGGACSLLILIFLIRQFTAPKGV